MNQQERNSLILSHIQLANKVARSKKRKLFSIELEELEAAAYLGLVQAANSYDPMSCDQFSAFAIRRIIGAIQDYLRELSWGKRKQPWNREVDFVLEDILIVDKEQDDDLFEKIIDCLPERWKLVIRKYYLFSESLQVIADFLGVTESRAFQLLVQSRNRLREYWMPKQIELYEAVA